MAQYTKGQKVRVSAVFRNNSDVVADPSTITFKWQTPAGVDSDYVYGTDAELVKDSTGNYHVDLTLNEADTWVYRFESTGNPVAADEESLGVAASQF